MTLKRYDLGREYAGNTGSPAIIEQSGGAYVRHDDHLALADELRAEKDALEQIAMAQTVTITELRAAELGQQRLGKSVAEVRWRNGEVIVRWMLPRGSDPLEAGTLLYLAPPPDEPVVRYCPGCGSIGPVEDKYRDCCPDGNEARTIPQGLAEKCRDTFKVAIHAMLAEQAANDSAPAAAQPDPAMAGVPAASINPQITLTLRQAMKLVEFFGGHDAEVSLGECPFDPPGLYAWCTEYPDEGSQYLGPTEVDDDLAMNGVQHAIMQAIDEFRDRLPSSFLTVVNAIKQGQV